ncbi:MAG: cellulase family glycosylhydrolase [Candidatus Pacebacteria bacterium]|nr:cellulase family glycosylhydrolase [Candidatus Paceibacterota bacterium]
MILFVFLALFLIFAGYLFLGIPSQTKEIKWGVNFSQKHTELLGLDWKETYSALIEDMGAKNIKLATYWDLIEKEEGIYNFEDLDWQMQTAQDKGAEILLVIGMKTPRWPECHIPGWAKGLGKEQQQEKILNLIEKIVSRYADSEVISMWQVENEPFFPFGDCPWTDKDFLKKEIAKVKSLDQQNRKILISDSGEGSFWFSAASLGDIVGTTMYRKVWVHQLGRYLNYPFPPTFYSRKAQIIKTIFNKEVICVELQAEPWGPALLYHSSLEEQEKTMNLEQFKKNIEFAKRTGLKEFYLWGAEWMYWLKEKEGKPEIWQEAKKLF